MNATVILTAVVCTMTSAQTVQDSVLRAQLLVRMTADQDVRRIHFTQKLQQGLQPDPADIRALIEVDSNNTAWMKSVVQHLGWPGVTLVGQDGQEAAFLLVQHADRDTAFQIECLQLLRRAFAAGETTGQHLALLTDRIEVAAGHAQIYGTQALIENNRVIFHPIQDSASVDQRRSELGMVPLSRYKSLLDSLYTKREK